MRNAFRLNHCLWALLLCISVQYAYGRKRVEAVRDTFPDGAPVSEWFRDTLPVDVASLGRQYRITDYGVSADSYVHTKELQALIDMVAGNGGGVVVVPPGVFMTGALFFKQGTHLHLERGAVLRGSTDISDFPVTTTRMEGQTCKYFPALLNADSIQGFTITGEGVVDGNGLPYWKAFWLRRKWNPAATNKDEQRPRVLFVSRCRDVRIEGVCFQNSPFWTTHYYQSENVRLMNLKIYSPHGPIHAPSTDAIDIDACRNVLVKGCEMTVDDDAIALKGGKGPWADIPEKTPGNGGNENILIEDCASGGHRLEPSFLGLCQLASATDSHEQRELPIIAANLHRAMLPEQSLIWAVLRRGDSIRRLVWSVAATFLGVMCLSGDVEALSAEQWAVVERGIAFYRRAEGVIRDGVTVRHGPRIASYRHPRGWQAVERTSPDGGAKLVVGHVFDGVPERMAIPVGEEYVLERVFAEDDGAVAHEGGMLAFALPANGAFAALLKRRA